MPDETATFEHFQIARREDGSLFELGRGTMGVTYKAYDTRLDGYVALKVINPGYLNDDVGRERFLREARAAAHLDHPNVAAIFHRGEAGGTYFYAMQFIDGETLDAYVRRRGTLPVALALKIIMQAAQGLAAANARGLIHRDIKPANLMLVHLDATGLPAGPPISGDSTDGEDLLVKVIDFGLAKVVLDDKRGSNVSLTGDGPVGTPYYMSPEQIDSSIGEVDARTDIYSLGVTLWYLLMGQPPFVGTQFQVFRQHISAAPPLAQLPPAVSDSVRVLLGRMMAKTPADRPANMRELIGEIRDLLRGSLVAPAAVGSLPPGAPPAVLPPTIPSIPVSALPPPLPVITGATPADTSRPPASPPPLSPPVSYPQVPFTNLPPPAAVYVPPPKVSHGLEWKIFAIVVVVTLVLGGGLLAILIPIWNRRDRAPRRPALAAVTPAPSVAASPTRASMWKSVPSPTMAGGTPGYSSPPPAAARTLTVPGQFSTVQAAVDAARPGETVRVGAGTYQEKIVFKAGIRLVGDDMNTTTISVAGVSDCLDVKGCASGSISGFTFEHTAANPPNDVQYVVWLHGSAVQMRNCRVRNSGSVGLSCEEGDKSLVEDCEVVGSHGFGLRAEGAGTMPTFRNNRVNGSGWTGIMFSDGAGGLADNNVSEDNVEFGFGVLNKGTAPTLTGNTARHNKLSGFAYQKEAGGRAEGNTAVQNTEAGFRISESGTAPTLANDQARDNGLSGIIFIDGAGGTLENTTAEANAGSGILVRSSGTAPVLRNNRLVNNKVNGLFFGAGGGGTAEVNFVNGNVQSGVFVTDKGSAPRLRGNQIKGNGGDGISVRAGAGGVLEGNICEGNTHCGIGIYDAGTSPVLSDNKCQSNSKENTFVERGATPKKGGKYEGFFK